MRARRDVPSHVFILVPEAPQLGVVVDYGGRLAATPASNTHAASGSINGNGNALLRSPQRALRSPGLHRRGSGGGTSPDGECEWSPPVSPPAFPGEHNKPVPNVAFVMGTFFSWSALGVVFFWLFSWPAGITSFMGTICCCLFFSRLSQDTRPAQVPTIAQHKGGAGAGGGLNTSGAHSINVTSHPPPKLPPLGAVSVLALTCAFLNCVLLLSTSAVFLGGRPELVDKWLSVMGRTPVSSLFAGKCGGGAGYGGGGDGGRDEIIGPTGDDSGGGGEGGENMAT
eukprot:CAMPEP_0197575102 /NCGR_PEP_ID=MMETSP1326-20131121/612_1 /TAXON_ID=1155430 /ORGANISM="Genus nov. species nov., Strain RCC2288" /LENGTH=282 /DNA_ID=CAMNT_0043137809 /DNA_START=221 /DNA_END=1065 /DNA_ORIENTATION=+